MKKLFVVLSSPQLIQVDYSGSHGCYSAVVPDALSKNKVSKLCNYFGFKPDAGKFHVTLMYSRKPVSDSEPKRSVFKGVCSELTSWRGHDNKTYIVALIKSDDLNKEHERLKSLGAEHSFGDYSAHITLDAREGEISQRNKLIIEKLNEQLEKYPISMTFIHQFIGDVKGA
jgi:hypothetical protein